MGESGGCGREEEEKKEREEGHFCDGGDGDDCSKALAGVAERLCLGLLVDDPTGGRGKF